MKIEFKNKENHIILDVEDYKVEDNKATLYLNSVENAPFNHFDLTIDGSLIQFNYYEGLKCATITFDDKKHVDFIMGLIKMSAVKNKIGNFFKF